jgi:general secretion pathway protein A
LIYRHTGGVPRQINTLCSRLLLFGFLEEMHTLQAPAVEKVANDLRQEIAVVTTDPATDVPVGEPNGKLDSMSEVAKRLGALEESVSRHGRVIKRAIEIATAYFQSGRT